MSLTGCPWHRVLSFPGAGERGRNAGDTHTASFVAVNDGVLAFVGSKDIGVGAEAAGELVVIGATEEDIVASAADENVVAGTCDQNNAIDCGCIRSERHIRLERIYLALREHVVSNGSVKNRLAVMDRARDAAIPKFVGDRVDTAEQCCHGLQMAKGHMLRVQKLVAQVV